MKILIVISLFVVSFLLGCEVTYKKYNWLTEPYRQNYEDELTKCALVSESYKNSRDACETQVRDVLNNVYGGS